MTTINLQGFKIYNCSNTDFVFDDRGHLYVTFYGISDNIDLIFSIFQYFVVSVASKIKNVYIRSCNESHLKLNFIGVEKIENFVFHNCNIDSIMINGLLNINQLFFSGTGNYIGIINELIRRGVTIINFFDNDISINILKKISNPNIIKNIENCKISYTNKSDNFEEFNESDRLNKFKRSIKCVNIFRNNTFEHVGKVFKSTNVTITDDNFND